MLPKRDDLRIDDRGLRLASAVAGYVKEAKVVDICSSASEAPRAAVDLSGASTLPALRMVDAMLMLRRSLGGELEDLARTCETHLRVPLSDAMLFFKGYGEVASPLKFLDFEPDDLRTGRSSRLRVGGGRARRRMMHEVVFEKAIASRDFAATTAVIVNGWPATVLTSEPRFVSFSLASFSLQVYWLKQIGYSGDQLMVHMHGATAEVRTQVTALGCKIHPNESRSASAMQIGSKIEFGIEIEGAKQLPN